MDTQQGEAATREVECPMCLGTVQVKAKLAVQSWPRIGWFVTQRRILLALGVLGLVALGWLIYEVSSLRHEVLVLQEIDRRGPDGRDD